MKFYHLVKIYFKENIFIVFENSGKVIKGTVI